MQNTIQVSTRVFWGMTFTFDSVKYT